MKDYTHRKSPAGAFLLGVGTAIVVGGYILFGSKNARRNRIKVDWWVDDAKREIYLKMKKVKDLTRDKYNDIVDDVTEKYSEYKDIGKDRIAKFKETLRKRWDEVEEYDDID